MGSVNVDEKALGAKLQLARKRAKLTQQELCQKAGLSYSTLAKIERGAIRSPSVFTVASIAEATGTPIEKLLDLKRVAAEPADSKKRSKNGVRFVYLDVNGTLARFFEKAFDKVSSQSRKPIETVETLFWRYDRPACEGKLTLAEANKIIGAELGLKNFDWLKYYLLSVEATPGAAEMVGWIAEHYDIGLLSNNWPGFTEALMAKKVIPKVDYAVVIESAKAGCAKPDPKIYAMAQQQAGASADEILLIDDTPAYLTGADLAGWQVLRFDGLDPKRSIARVRQALEF
ncbi:HAD-IA family hydrolase [Candidatus Saccharibacteria bacterium]|nr:HAD-IA family hydrolase [Candidatus Saccharibacteria bacterium]